MVPLACPALLPGSRAGLSQGHRCGGLSLPASSLRTTAVLTLDTAHGARVVGVRTPGHVCACVRVGWMFFCCRWETAKCRAVSLVWGIRVGMSQSRSFPAGERTRIAGSNVRGELPGKPMRRLPYALSILWHLSLVQQNRKVPLVWGAWQPWASCLSSCFRPCSGSFWYLLSRCQLSPG